VAGQELELARRGSRRHGKREKEPGDEDHATERHRT
jgi:hypothetical protein